MAAVDALDEARRLRRWTDVLAVADVVRAIDPAVSLAATLRDAVLDEVGWPALDALASSFGGAVETMSRYPFLALREGSRVAVVGPNGVVLDHDELLPAAAVLADVRVARDAVLVAYGPAGCTPFFRLADVLGVWSDRPDRRTGFREVAFGASGVCGYLDEDGAVVMGGRKLAPRRRTGPLRRTWSDGGATWVLEDRSGPLRAVDPSTGEHIDAPMPDLVREAEAEGCEVEWGRSWLTPRLRGATDAVGEKEGVVGALVVRRGEVVESWLPDGTRMSGARLLGMPWPATVGPRWFVGALGNVGDLSDLGRAALLRADGSGIAFRLEPERTGVRVRLGREDAWPQPTWAAGTPLMAPWFFRTLFAARDPRGSAALRRVDAEGARRILDAHRRRAVDIFHDALADVSHPALRRGIVGLVEAVTEAQRRLDAVLAAIPTEDAVPPARREVVKARLHAAIAGRIASPRPNAVTYPPIEVDLTRAIREGRDVAGVRPEDLVGATSAVLWLAASPAWDEDTRLDLVELAGALLHGANDADAFALRRMATHLRARGGWRWDTAVAQRLASATGLSIPEATLVAAGLARHEPPPSALWSMSVVRHQQHGPFGQGLGVASEASRLGLSTAEARAAHQALADVPESAWRAVYGATLPADPSALDDPFGRGPDDDGAWVERLSRAWNEIVGRRPEVGPAAVDEARRALDEPFVARHLGWIVDPTGIGPARWPSEIGHLSGLEPVRGLVRAILWAFVARPVGDRLRLGIPEAIRAARLQLPSWPLVTFAWKQDGLDGDAQEQELVSVAERLGTRVVPWDPRPEDAIVVRRGSGCGFVQLRPALVDVSVLDELVDQLGRPRQGADRCAVRALRWLISDDEADRFDARVKLTPVPDGRWEADPRASAPGSVDVVADRLEVDADAAALWLQLQVLPNPTEDAVRTTLGWDDRRVVSAAATLTARGELVRDKRRRADRRWFLPGPWVELAAPCVPAEESKLELLGVRFPRGPRHPPMWEQVLLDRPVHELFEAAAERADRAR